MPGSASELRKSRWVLWELASNPNNPEHSSLFYLLFDTGHVPMQKETHCYGRTHKSRGAQAPSAPLLGTATRFGPFLLLRCCSGQLGAQTLSIGNGFLPLSGYLSMSSGHHLCPDRAHIRLTLRSLLRPRPHRYTSASPCRLLQQGAGHTALSLLGLSVCHPH